MTRARSRNDETTVDLASLPVLSLRRVCELLDCHPSTVRRSSLVPCGRRSRTPYYRTSDVLALLENGRELATIAAPVALRPLRAESKRKVSNANVETPLAKIARVAREGV